MVTQALIRKARHVLGDPVLRRWLLRRVAGLERSPATFTAGQPPYLGRTDSASGSGAAPLQDFPRQTFSPPLGPTRIVLPGQTVNLTPDDPGILFTQPYDDLETNLAAHRFAWVPIAGDEIDRDWVAALWECWSARFGSETSGWPWHAYTAAERAINIIDFSRRFGLPGDPVETSTLLLRHAKIIRGNLEYFGDHYTSNHLSNNGRGLLRIGTAFGHRGHADTGAKIMVAEAGRIFGRSGVLREGSTHYHLLVTRNYIDAWEDAQVAGLEQSGMLRDIAERALAAIPGLYLPGGMPLIGDISPDTPPAYLGRLAGAAGGKTWPVNLVADRQREIDTLIARNVPVSPDKLAEDGWHRFGGHSWQALAFVCPDGWPPMPGHGHQDLGSFELHDGATKVLVDPGRGSYANAAYQAADMHSCVLIDGAGPVPVNRAYYSPAFRRRVVDERPTVKRTRDGSILNNAGFRYLADVGEVQREWRFTESRVEITDRIGGRGRRQVRRQFCTPYPVRIDGDTAVVKDGAISYRLSFGAAISVKEIICWSEYGEGTSGSLIFAKHSGTLPFEAVTTIERV